MVALAAKPLVPLMVVALGGAAWYKTSNSKDKSGLTAERELVYQQALKDVRDPDKLRSLADAYEKEGLKAQADMLRKRATLRALPEEVKAKRRDALRKGLQSSDPAAVEALAKAFEAEGATGASLALRKYAQGLRLVDTAAIAKLAAEFDKGGESEKLAGPALRKRIEALNAAKAAPTTPAPPPSDIPPGAFPPEQPAEVVKPPEHDENVVKPQE